MSSPLISFPSTQELAMKHGWNHVLRMEHRYQKKIPAWVPIGDDDPDFRKLWQEDDARPPDGESGDEAWLRIFGERRDPADYKQYWDGGDSYAELHIGNRVYECSCGLITIWQYVPPRKFD